MRKFDKAAKIFLETKGVCWYYDISISQKDLINLDCIDCPFESQGNDHNCPKDEICYQWAIGYLAMKERENESSIND